MLEGSLLLHEECRCEVLTTHDGNGTCVIMRHVCLEGQSKQTIDTMHEPSIVKP